jgi:hypothetical protein
LARNGKNKSLTKLKTVDTYAINGSKFSKKVYPNDNVNQKMKDYSRL